MTEQEARSLQRKLENLLDGHEIGLLRAEEDTHIPGYWGVTLRLTWTGDWPVLRRAVLRSDKRSKAIA